MSKKVVFIVNPVAGKGQIRGNLFDVVSPFCLPENEVSICMTTCKGDAVRIAKAYAEKADLLICVGGDGTLSEVTSVLAQMSAPPTLGYIPMGTANDVASTLHLSRTPKTAATDIRDGTPHQMDIGCFNKDNYFTYIAAFGAFTEVSYQTPQNVKNTLGHLAYVLTGLTHLGSITPHHVKIRHDNGIMEGDFIFGAVTNSTSVAGLVKLESSAVELGDGLFEVLLIRQPQNLAHFNALVANILTMKYDPEYVVFLHTKKIEFVFDKPVAWTRDGEDGGMHQSAEIVNLHHAFEIIVPPEKKEAADEY